MLVWIGSGQLQHVFLFVYTNVMAAQRKNWILKESQAGGLCKAIFRINRCTGIRMYDIALCIPLQTIGKSGWSLSAHPNQSWVWLMLWGLTCRANMISSCRRLHMKWGTPREWSEPYNINICSNFAKKGFDHHSHLFACWFSLKFWKAICMSFQIKQMESQSKHMNSRDLFSLPTQTSGNVQEYNTKDVNLWLRLLSRFADLEYSGD